MSQKTLSEELDRMLEEAKGVKESPSTTREDVQKRRDRTQQLYNDTAIKKDNCKFWQYGKKSGYQTVLNMLRSLLDELDEELEYIPGTTGPLVNLFENELTEEEWLALRTVHHMRLRLECGIRFDWSKSIDVKHKGLSQIVDEQVIYRNCPVDDEEEQ